MPRALAVHSPREPGAVRPVSDEAWRRFLRLEAAPPAAPAAPPLGDIKKTRVAAAAPSSPATAKPVAPPIVARPRVVKPAPVAARREDVTAVARSDASSIDAIDRADRICRADRADRNGRADAAPSEIADGRAAGSAAAVELAWIVEEAALVFGISVDALLGSRRLRVVARPRQAAMWVCKQLTQRSMPSIGRAFGRDHTTVLYGCRTIDAVMRIDADFAAQMHMLLDRVRARALRERFDRWVARQSFAGEGDALRRIWA